MVTDKLVIAEEVFDLRKLADFTWVESLELAHGFCDFVLEVFLHHRIGPGGFMFTHNINICIQNVLIPSFFKLLLGFCVRVSP